MNVYSITGRNYNNPTINKHCLNSLAKILIKNGYAAEATFICGNLSEDTIITTNPSGLENEERTELENTKEKMLYLRKRCPKMKVDIIKYLEKEDSEWEDEENIWKMILITNTI